MNVNRQKMTRLIYKYKRDILQIEDDVWRGHILPRFGATPDDTGHVSLNSVPTDTLTALVDELKAKAGESPDPRAALIAKIKNLWGTLFDAGVVRNNSNEALERWAKRITKTDKLGWAAPRALVACVEGLKSWGKRQGVEL